MYTAYLDYLTKSYICKSWSDWNKIESTYVIKLSCKINMTYSGRVVLKEKIFQWPHQSFAFLWLSLLRRLIDYLRFYVPLKNISLIWRRHHCRWRAAKFRPMLGAQGLWAGRDLYRATPTVTRDLGFSGLIRRTAPFSRLLRHAWECGGPILTRILMGNKDL
jgi:hypothetical protein